MMNECPAFDILSRFADGALEPASERGLVAHVAGCASCSATLSSIEEVDGLIAFSLPQAKARRFHLLRPAMIPVAAAILFGVTIGVLLSMPSSNNGGDTPIAVAEVSPPAGAPAVEPVRNVYCQDQFAAAQLSPLWKTSEMVSSANALVDVSGRRALSLVAQPGGRKRWALVSTSSEFPVGDGVSFDVDYRVPKPQKGGRVQVLLQSGTGKAGRSVLRWSRTAEEEILEAQDSRTRPTVLWSSKSGADSEWHRVNLVVTSREVILHRDGVETARKAHGLSLERAGLTLGSTMDKRSRESHESFECQVGGVVVRREQAQ